MTEKRIGFLGLSLLHSVIFIYVFGAKIIRINSIFFADCCDAAKNYYTYYYYTNVQKGGGLLFEGMNYPFGEYIFYTDNTPVLAIIAKALHLQNSIGFYNSVFLLLWFVVPFAAYNLLRLLQVRPVVAAIFSFLMCWTNPLINHFGSTVNLSLFIFYLLAAIFFIKHVTATKAKTQYNYLGAQILLVYIASFFHLYYLPIMLLFLGGSYLGYSIFFKRYKLLLQAVILAAVSGGAVFFTIYIFDAYYTIRPSGAGGYGYDLFRNSVSDLVKSFTYLDFPNPIKYNEWNDQKWGFLGNGYLMAIPFIICSTWLFFVHLKKSGFKLKTLAPSNRLILSILLGGAACLFVSLGDNIHILNGRIKFDNIFNPFFYGAKVTDFFTHFRYLRRFSAPFWMAYFILLSALFSILWQRKKLIGIFLKSLMILFILISGFDAVQYISFHHENYERDNFFTDKNLEYLPKFEPGKYDAIFPIPYFHVGTDNLDYLIDDDDAWSRQLYQLSVKNALPLMACKMCRTPFKFAQDSYSLFAPETDKAFATSLKDKKILLVVSENCGWNESTELAKTLKLGVDAFIDKHNTKLLFTKDGTRYYETTMN